MQIAHFILCFKLPAKFYSPQPNEGEITFTSIAAESTPIAQEEKTLLSGKVVESAAKRGSDISSDIIEETKPVGILKRDDKQAKAYNDSRYLEEPVERGKCDFFEVFTSNFL